MRNTQEHTEPIQEERSQKSKHLGLLRGTGVHSLLWPSAQRTQLALFVGRGERPERRERWNEEPPKVRRRSEPLPAPLPLQMDGDVCGEGVNTCCH